MLCGRPKRSLAENGKERYGTAWTRSVDKFGGLTVLGCKPGWGLCEKWKKLKVNNKNNAIHIQIDHYSKYFQQIIMV